jgi:GNAT superfamily N-acetyltransferase
MEACHVTDNGVIPCDPRMAAYLDGKRHPQKALPLRTGYVACVESMVIGYIAGHLTTRNDCAGEIEYLFVSPSYRRRGIGTTLLQLMATWFTKQGARRVCVPVANDSPPEAKPFYEHAGASPLRQFWYGWEDVAVVLDEVRRS